MIGGELSEYELQRQRNIENNKAVLASLGLDSPVEFHPTTRRTPAGSAPAKKPPAKKRVTTEVETSEVETVASETVRRSSRQRKKTVFFTDRETEVNKVREVSEEAEEEEEEDGYEKKTGSRRGMKASPQRVVTMPKGKKWEGGNIFGSIPNVPVGQTWEKRCDVSWAGVHRPWVAGIFGNTKFGCYSICLSGGYEDDIDYGDAFVYTGAGGRDLKGTKANPKNLRSAPQSSDQTLTGSNLALHLNIESRKPVRVVRGFKSPSQYAPASGYRYDGLYTVETSWMDTGLSGFKVWHFALKRIPGQPPLGQTEPSLNAVVTPRREGLRSGKSAVEQSSTPPMPADQDGTDATSRAESKQVGERDDDDVEEEPRGSENDEEGTIGEDDQTEGETPFEDATTIPSSSSAKRKRGRPAGKKAKIPRSDDGPTDAMPEAEEKDPGESETSPRTTAADDEAFDTPTVVSSSAGTDLPVPEQVCDAQRTANGCETEPSVADGEEVRSLTEANGEEGSIGR